MLLIAKGHFDHVESVERGPILFKEDFIVKA